ncbi:reverse transcriptase-like protein [Nymphaea thermarum]|nr:reverse transcriptase-like protein [Nymphaea thermarum]
MPSVINLFQVAFVKGRHLQDVVVLANEVVHSLYCLRLPSFILKLDFFKAFDSVNWEFFPDLLTRFAFGPSFRQWIMSLVTGAQLAVSFNGKCGDFFCLERGLRQGCPLSSLLFNMVAESFSAFFHHATVVGFLTPHSLSHLPSFSTLQYADDFLLFGSASRQQVVRTWLILRVFELISGLSIYSAKCHFSLIHADPATVLLAKACFGCKATGLPMDYLVLQITLSSLAPSFWDGVEQKLTDRLQCWQEKLLSLSGRITLAKHYLASVPLHALSVFRPLVAVLRRPWLISAWRRIWAERNNKVFRGTFSSPAAVARLVQGDVQFAIRFKRRCQSAVGYRYGITDSSMGGIRNCPHYKMVVVPGVVQWLLETLVSRVVSSPSERDLTCGRKDLGRSYPVIYRLALQMDSVRPLVGCDIQVEWCTVAIAAIADTDAAQDPEASSRNVENAASEEDVS